MPCGPSSCASAAVIEATATLRTDPTNDDDFRAFRPLTFTMRPHPCARISGATARAHRR